jgi:hypothetical protein
MCKARVMFQSARTEESERCAAKPSDASEPLETCGARPKCSIWP